MSSHTPFAPLVRESHEDDTAGHAHRQAIGYLGAILAPVLWLLNSARPTTGLDWDELDSVSAYFWSSGVIAFVGILAVIATYMIAYGGYDTADGWRDRLGSTIAGIAAAVVAIFPTTPPGNTPVPEWWRDWIGDVHGWAAMIFFLAFVYFCFFRFTKVGEGFAWSQASRARWDTTKRWENGFYVVCGVAILVCLALIVRDLRADDSIYAEEVAAIAIFALAWLVKGHALYTATRAGERLAHGVLHPLQSLSRLRALFAETLEAEKQVNREAEEERVVAKTEQPEE